MQTSVSQKGKKMIDFTIFVGSIDLFKYLTRKFNLECTLIKVVKRTKAPKTLIFKLLGLIKTLITVKVKNIRSTERKRGRKYLFDMERKGSAKKWGGLFKLFGRTETDTKEEDIETEEAQNSVQEEIMNKEIEVQEINIETNPMHSASSSENVTSNQQFAGVTKELGGLFELFESTETDTKDEDIETEETLNSVQEEIMNKEEEVQEINIETNTEPGASVSENATPNEQFAEVTKEYR